ncbi:MAG TPA: hypothetical protein VIW69_04805 [Candidatus Elarobacter sp.]
MSDSDQHKLTHIQITSLLTSRRKLAKAPAAAATVTWSDIEPYLTKNNNVGCMEGQTPPINLGDYNSVVTNKVAINYHVAVIQDMPMDPNQFDPTTGIWYGLATWNAWYPACPQ